ncbi:MAG: ATP-dependent helicase HrpB, partial [Myxococcales bacterium]|nr:ATP-dependent helicase HrpB [Myxococcales bacterium]
MAATHLPIDDARARFTEALRADAPVIVTAPTGSGKSTRLPLWLGFDVACGAGPTLVVEPRRVACRALALWLARGRGEPVGASIGYRVRFDDRRSADTRVLFVTPGVALNMFADGSALEFATILVDEFHERGWEVDLVVLLARRALARRGAAPRLVLCSATLDVDALVEQLGATLVRAEGRRFPVSITYEGDEAPSPVGLERRVADALTRLAGDRERDTGDILVFLPGKREIERCRQIAQGLPLTPVIVHGGVSPERLVRAFAPADAGAPARVYLATNVAETSLTVPGIRFVVDPGFARISRYSARTKVQR